MAKYDWIKLKQEYITGDYKSLKEFAEKKKINYDMLRRNAKTWSKEKVTKRSQKGHKIIEKTIERQIDAEVDRNTRHLQTFDKMQDAIEKILTQYDKPSKRDIYTLLKAGELMDKIQKGQRLAEGMDVGGGTNTGDINITVVPASTGDDD